jgi:hypothetical protein
MSNLGLVVNLKNLPKGSSKAKAAAAAAGLTGFTTSNVVQQQAWFNFTTAAQAAAAAPHLLASFPGSKAKGVHARAVPRLNPPVGMAVAVAVAVAVPVAVPVFAVGDTCVIIKMTSASDLLLNGTTATVTTPLDASGRIIVQLSGGPPIKMIAVKPENLVKMESPAPKIGVPATKVGSTPPKEKKTPKEAIVVLDMVNIFRDAEGIATDMGLSGYVDCGSSLNKKTGVQSG